MADYFVDDKLLGNNNQNTNQTGMTNPYAQEPTTGTSGVVNGANNQAVSTAGIGSGGTGGWTNIQAYLGANRGDTGSSKNLEEKANSTYSNEENALNTQATDTQGRAQAEAKKVQDVKDNSKAWINQAANAYSWDGQQGNDYNSNVNKIKDVRASQYAGPNSFAYGKTADFQRANTALGDDKNFTGYMTDIYRQKAGGQLNAGQTALQTQLDINNQALADTRKNMLAKYAGFDDVANKKVTETDAAIKKAREDFGNNQNSLSLYLQGLGKDYESAQNQAEIDARAKHDYSLNNDKSGLGNALRANYDTAGSWKSWLNAAGDAYGMNSDNATWKQLDNEEKAKNARFSSGGYEAPFMYSSPYDVKGNASYLKNQDALKNFYNSEVQKYANTGDSEKKNWNTIMDILNNSARKQQGFNVRGA